MNIEEARNYVFSLPEKDRVKVGDLIESAMAAEQRGSREMRYDWLELSHIARLYLIGGGRKPEPPLSVDRKFLEKLK